MSRRSRFTIAVQSGVRAWNARPPMSRTRRPRPFASATSRSASASGSLSVGPTTPLDATWRAFVCTGRQYTFPLFAFLARRRPEGWMATGALSVLVTAHWCRHSRGGPGMGVAGRTLFTRQSSGLVREVSVANALFFNTAAFIGGTLGGAYGIAVLAGVPVVVVGLVTNWSVVAFVVGAFCVLLAIIFASLTTVMPRSGGDYVFTSRIVPRIGPFLGWLESWMLAFASIALLQFETVLTLRGIQMEGRIIGIGTCNDFFNCANSWFTEGSTGDITGVPGMIAGLVVIAVVAFVVLQPTRTFHRIVTWLTVLGIVGWALMAVFGLVFFDAGQFAANLPKFANGTTVDSLAKAATDANLTGTSFSFGPVDATTWPFFLLASAMLV